MSKKISQLTPSTAPTSGDIVPLASSAGSTIGVKLRHVKDLFDNDAGLNRNRGVSGSPIFSGHVSITGDLRVSGNSYIGRSNSTSTIITGPLRGSGNLIYSGSAIITGDFTATGNNILLGNNASSLVYISGRLVSAGSSIFNGNHSISGFCHVSGPFVLSGSGTFGVSGQSNVQHTFFGRTLFDQTGIFNSGISVRGGITGNNLYIGDIAELRGTNYLYGNTSIGSSSSNTLSIASTSTFNSPAIFTTNQEVQGNLNLWGNFNNSGTSTFGNGNTDSATFHGNFTSRNYASFWSGVVISGNTEISGATTVRGTGIFSTGVSIAGPLTTSGRNYLGNLISNPTHIQGTGYISGAADIRGYLGVSGNIHCGGTIFSNQVKSCIFNPQIRAGLRNGIYFDSGVGVNKVKFLFYRNQGAYNPGNDYDELDYPDSQEQGDRGLVAWNTGDFQQNDILFISGITGLSSTVFSPFLSTANKNKMQGHMRHYNGYYIIESTYVNNNDMGLILTPTGLKMSPPSSDDPTPNHLSSGALPYILAHYRSGWLLNVSGVSPVRGSSNLGGLNDNVFHHKIIFNSSFNSDEYMCGLSCNQGSGYAGGDTNRLSYTEHLKMVNVSYFDRSSPSEKIIYAGLPSGRNETDLRECGPKHYFASSPTRVYCRFEALT